MNTIVKYKLPEFFTDNGDADWKRYQEYRQEIIDEAIQDFFGLYNFKYPERLPDDIVSALINRIGIDPTLFPDLPSRRDFLRNYLSLFRNSLSGDFLRYFIDALTYAGILKRSPNNLLLDKQFLKPIFTHINQVNNLGVFNGYPVVQKQQLDKEDFIGNPHYIKMKDILITTFLFGNELIKIMLNIVRGEEITRNAFYDYKLEGIPVFHNGGFAFLKYRNESPTQGRNTYALQYHVGITRQEIETSVEGATINEIDHSLKRPFIRSDHGLDDLIDAFGYSGPHNIRRNLIQIQLYVKILIPYIIRHAFSVGLSSPIITTRSIFIIFFHTVQKYILNLSKNYSRSGEAIEGFEYNAYLRQISNFLSDSVDTEGDNLNKQLNKHFKENNRFSPLQYDLDFTNIL